MGGARFYSSRYSFEGGLYQCMVGEILIEVSKLSAGVVNRPHWKWGR